MAKTRMTNHLRGVVEKGLFRHATKRLAEALIERESALFDRVALEALGDDHAKVETLPEGWLPMVGSLHVNALGWAVELRRQSVDDACFAYGTAVGKGLPRRLPHNLEFGRVNVRDEALARDIQAHVQNMKEQLERVGRLRGSIRSTVAAFGTVEALLKEIPELAELVPDLAGKKPVTALVPAVKNLLCDIAAFRGEERTGCPCDAEGNPVELAEAA
jgi:hypothetical protein